MRSLQLSNDIITLGLGQCFSTKWTWPLVSQETRLKLAKIVVIVWILQQIYSTFIYLCKNLEYYCKKLWVGSSNTIVGNGGSLKSIRLRWTGLGFTNPHTHEHEHVKTAKMTVMRSLSTRRKRKRLRLWGQSTINSELWVKQNSLI